MKKLGISLLIFLFALSLAYALVQSNIGKSFIRSKITETLAAAGFTAKIGEVAGTLPNEIRLTNVSIIGEGIELQASSVKLRPVLWRFLKGEIAFKEIEAKDLSLFENAPVNFEGKFWMNAKSASIIGQVDHWNINAHLNLHTRTLQFTANSSLGNVKGNADLSSDYHLQNAQLQLSSEELIHRAVPQASGRIVANLVIVKEKEELKGDIHWKIPNLSFGKTELGALKGEGNGVLKGNTLAGQLTTGSSKITFDWSFRPQALIVGKNQVTIDNLQSLHIPDTYGNLQGEVLWSIVEGKQALKIDAAIENFYYKEFFAQKALIYSDLNQHLFDIHIEKGKWHDLRVDQATLEIQNGFTLTATGEWKHPLKIEARGLFDETHIHIDALSGTFFNHPLLLEKPVDLKWENSQLDLSFMQLKVADASITAEIHKNDAMLQLHQLPLDFLSLNPLDVSIGGLIDLKAEFHDHKGSFSANLIQTEPFDASGCFKGDFNRDLLHLQGNLNVKGKSVAEVNGSFPIHFSLFPFKVTLLPHGDVKGDLSFEGPVEEVLDFFDLGPHRLEGHIRGKLSLRNTFYHPIVEGSCLFEKGSYENYYTGTTLKNIQAEFVAKDSKIHLTSLTAVDEPGDGAFGATGEIHLNAGNLYPFHFNVHLDDFQFTGVDLVTASADGHIRIEGNLSSALASGELLVTESTLTIPDHIALPLPELNVTYINQERPAPPALFSHTPYPLHLNLQVRAPKVLISGRGLSSTWQGTFHIGGTLTSIATQGELKLVDGDFRFSSKRFDLTHGSLSFSGVEQEMPKIDIAGAIEVQGVAITVQLHGPLDNPQIALQSNPPLPLSSIMSHLLFGQDLSEISGFQAFELASSIAGLAGTGPDVMESTRKSLGVDRLRIVADPENGEPVALEVGKYVSKGVLVTLTQGVQESSTNIRIEVELKGRLILQLESDQHQEQGKFTLKWQLNY